MNNEAKFDAKLAFEAACAKLAITGNHPRAEWTYPDLEAEAAFQCFLAGAEWMIERAKRVQEKS